MPITQLLYNFSPEIIQTLFLNSYAVKMHFRQFTRKFTKQLDHLLKSQWWTLDEHINYQNERLQALIKHSYDTVPYYRDVMQMRHLVPDDIKTIADLWKLPVLTRETIKDNQHRLISRSFNRFGLIQGRTSGTTGSPLQFFWDRSTCIINNAVDWRQKTWAGLRYGDRYAVLLGRTIVPIKQEKPPFWRMNYIHNQLWFSSFHMTEQNLKYYLKKLEEFNPLCLEGYPSTLYILAKYLESQNKTFPVKSVLTSSETLHSVQKETIEKAFCCRVFDFYGLAERAIFATECDKHEGHHINMEYGIVEILNSEGTPVEKGGLGRLVGTSLHNFAMPFIRYKTNDISALLTKNCLCGRELPLMADVATKAEDIVVTRDGRYISPSLLTHPFKPLHNIKLSQIIQEDLDNLIIKIVPGLDYSDRDTEHLLSALKQRVGSNMKIEIQFVESIPRTSAGKFRWVISKVPLKF